MSTKSSSASPMGTSQNHQSSLRFPIPTNQPVTVQRIINPVLPHHNSVGPSLQVAPSAVSQAMSVSMHSEAPVGTATILPAQQLTFQPRPAGNVIAGPATSSITLTVTSIPSGSSVISSSSPTVPVITQTSTNNIQQFLQRPGMVISQPSVIRGGFPVVLPRSALTLGGRQQVLQGTLQRLIQRPMVSQAGNCGGQVTVQIPQIVGPIIKMPNYKQTTAPPTGASLVKDNTPQKALSPAVTTVVTSTSIAPLVTAATTITTLTSTQADLPQSTAINSNNFPTSSVSNTVSVLTTTTTASVTSVCSTPAQPIVSHSMILETNKTGSSESSHDAKSSKENTASSFTSTLSSGNKECKTEEDTVNGPVSLKKPSENASEENHPSDQKPEEKESATVGIIEASNISVLPNTLSSLRHNKSSLLPPPVKDYEIKKNSGVILTEGFIDSNLLDWSDKIGTLPGTDMKFKINEFGDLELLEECDNGTSSVKGDDGGDNKGVVDDEMEGNDEMDNEDEEGDSDEQKNEVPAVNDPSELSEKEDDPVCCCVYCGRYGYKSNFRTSGRFCSRTCAGMKNLHRKQMLMSRMVQESRKKKKMAEESNDAVTNEEYGRLEKGHYSFDWDKYLSETGAIGAPKKLFKEPFPSTHNGFKVGMRLEGVDPKHQSLICVLSVAELKGYRLRLHFDGYSECYDFWVNADSPFIFPVGWAEKSGKTLQPPKNMPISEFNWTSYLKHIRAVAAPKILFVNQPSSVTPSAFRVGLKLEARDHRKSDLFCVATVADTLGDRLLIHFDGYEDIYDFWCDISSPNIHPVGWCRQSHKKLTSPPDYGDADEKFNWDHYLADTKSTAVPSRAFKPRSPVGFEVGMKVEVTDKRNPILVRVATVKKVKNVRLLVHFDGWGNEYDYWIDDDHCDLHPPHWCDKTFHELQGPIDKGALQQEDNNGGCPTIGCKGIGHIKGAKYTGHHSDFGCPYSATNMSKDTCLADRLGSSRSEEGGGAFVRYDYNGDIRRCPTPGCNGAGHITGKFTSHHCVSGCPLAEKNLIKVKQETGVESRPVGRPARGRKRKMFSFGSFGQHDKHMKSESMDGFNDEGSIFRANVHESVFQSMAEYPPPIEQPLGWSHHTKLLPGVYSIDSSMVDKWSIDQVADFIQRLTGKEDQAQRFREEEIDGDSFLLLQQSDLVNFLNIKLGPAVKIFNSIQVFKAGMET